MTSPNPTPLTPQEKAEDLAANIEARFGSLTTFYGWLDGAALVMQRTRLETELGHLKEQQQTSRQQIEVGIQAKQAEFDTEIAGLRATQQADFDRWQTQVDAKQSELDGLNARIKGQVG